MTCVVLLHAGDGCIRLFAVDGALILEGGVPSTLIRCFFLGRDNSIKSGVRFRQRLVHVLVSVIDRTVEDTVFLVEERLADDRTAGDTYEGSTIRCLFIGNRPIKSGSRLRRRQVITLLLGMSLARCSQVH